MTAIVLDREERKSLQKALASKMRCELYADGHLGPKTTTVLKAYQTRQCIPPTGIYDEATAALLQTFMREMFIGEADYADAARQLDCEVEAVKTVKEVEVRGVAFLPDGRTRILFERHIFYRELAKKLPLMQLRGLCTTFPNIVSEETGGYMGEAAEWRRLGDAQKIDPHAALLSASIGMFQIMGFNHKACGFETVEQYWDVCGRSEREQLKSFISFIKANPKLHAALRTRQWRAFAVGYNGPNQKGYDVKMADTYAALKGH